MTLDLNEKITKYFNSKKLIILVFSAIFIFGITSVKDYGVSSDEYAQRIDGFVNLNYIGLQISPEITNKFKKDKNIPNLHDKDYSTKTYGSLFNTTAGIIEIVFDVKDKYNQFLLRHYLNFFIFFLSLICFYKLCYKRFGSWELSLLGVVLITLSPRIFANSFYNNKDIVFLSFLLFSVYFGVKFFNKNNLKNAILFALSNVFAIAGVRVHGLISPGIIYFLLIFYILISKDDVKNKIKLVLISIFFTIFFNILFWPYLWENPISKFIDVLVYLGEFGNQWILPSLFLGEINHAKDMPWYYSLLWILITTPIFYIFLFLVGFIFFIIEFFNNFKKNLILKKFYFDIIFASILLIPLIFSMIFSSTSFNGWRHLYFIYPYFIIYCLLGYKKINGFIIRRKFYLKIFNLLAFFIILYYLNWIVVNHPHQYAYFNKFAGKNIHKKFDIDYWGLSYKENLSFILKNDKRNEIYIKNISENKLFYPLFSLKNKDRQKFIFKFENREPDYIITNYYLEKKYNKFDENFLEEYYLYKTIFVGNTPINTVYKKNNIN